jgi:ATP-dependent RNA helicase RhlE
MGASFFQDTQDDMSFTSLGLSEALLRAVVDRGYTTATPIQTQTIPIILAGRDALATAQTGTGKTAAFALPILQRLAAAPASRRMPRALVLTPTRELAAQVTESFRGYGQHLRLRTEPVFGGVGMQPQIKALRRGTDILVCTPGRLIDHLEHGTADLSTIEILVLDEADRMLDMGFIPAIRRIIGLLPARRQNLMFSATFSPEIRKLAENLLNDPQRIDVAPRNAPADRVSHLVHPVDKDRKGDLLAHVITEGDWRQVLVFARTKHGADRLARRLQREGIEADALHGDKSQSARTRALAQFRQGRVRVLVATDIAARGLDIEQLPYVVNYELPHVPEDYVHRIGRTGRAGGSGDAISLVCSEEWSQLRSIERLLGCAIPASVIEGFEPTETVPAPARTNPANRRPGSMPPRHGAAHKPPQSHRRDRPGTHGDGRAQRRWAS